jgi:hypothetical protein
MDVVAGLSRSVTVTVKQLLEQLQNVNPDAQVVGVFQLDHRWTIGRAVEGIGAEDPADKQFPFETARTCLLPLVGDDTSRWANETEDGRRVPPSLDDLERALERCRDTFEDFVGRDAMKLSELGPGAAYAEGILWAVYHAFDAATLVVKEARIGTTSNPGGN